MFGIPFEISKGPAGGQWECKPREEFESVFEADRRKERANNKDLKYKSMLEEMLQPVCKTKKRRKRRRR